VATRSLTYSPPRPSSYRLSYQLLFLVLVLPIRNNNNNNNNKPRLHSYCAHIHIKKNASALGLA